MRNSLDSIRQKAENWLQQGISPRRLALTLALGFAFGCIPVFGMPTMLCVAAAFALRLNFPVIEAANWSAMPLQVMLMVPFVRMGQWLFAGASGPRQAVEVAALLHLSPLHLLSQIGSFAGHAMLAWLVIAVPAVALMTLTLTALLRRVPAVAEAEAGD